MSNRLPVLLDEVGPLRLERTGRWLSLNHDDELLLAFPLFSFRDADKPLDVALKLHRAMRPTPPKLVMNAPARRGFSGGLYSAPDDCVTISPGTGKRRVPDFEIAEVLVHELAHAAGHASRLGRAFMRCEPSQPDMSFSDQSDLLEDYAALPMPGSPRDQEELTACIGAALACVSVRLTCNLSAPRRWFHYAAGLPLDVLKLCVADAQASAAFILQPAAP